ncbi:MAG TPA: DUF1800 domain-containing protein [Gemmatimonadales bacterium]|jgi:uncharacterized protein (DUF1800 family)
MRIRIEFLVVGLAAGIAIPTAAQAPMTTRDSARHVLNRLAYGATTDEVDQVIHEGVLKWVDRQLGFADVHDPALTTGEARFDVLHESNDDMQALLQKTQARNAQVQSIGDSVERQQAMDQLRAEQRGDRRSLAVLDNQLAALVVVRAVASDHQLDEILCDFWTNHFNVFINKGQDRAYFADYLEHTIRARALGRFEDLLLATARSPAMLFYLDQSESVADASATRMAPGGRRIAINGRPGFGRGRPLFPDPRPGVYPPPSGTGAAATATRQQVAPRAPRGLNENYARELMELHTLGVDGGYTQQDVINVARILTGWGIDRRDASFTFRAAAHDEDAKTVMGQPFDAGHGEDEGVRLLKMLATSPATMHHVSAQLCARFVNDVPPDGCIDDAVQAWKKSGGEIRDVVRAIIRSPDFWASANVQSKVKTPLEFVASAVRAVGGVPDSTPRLAQRVAQLGEPLFQHQTPDGYGERQEDWVNSGALLARMNFAVQLASGRVAGVAVDLDRVVSATDDHAALVTAVDHAILGGAMTAQTRQTILKELADVPDPRAARALAVGLAIGGPEFQRQ